MEKKKPRKYVHHTKAHSVSDKEVREFYALLIKEQPDINVAETKAMVKAATKYAKKILKGKAAKLYGLSLDEAIKWMESPDTDPKLKRDIMIKVLGHCMPTEIHISGGDEDDGKKPIVFQMSRPDTIIEVVDKALDSVKQNDGR